MGRKRRHNHSVSGGLALLAIAAFGMTLAYLLLIGVA